MADRKALERRVMEIVGRQYRKAPAFQPDRPITASDRLREDLGFDSLALVVLQIELEDAFHIRFDPAAEDLQQIFTCTESLIESVQDHITAQT